jgi:hypothetical protein
MARGTNKERVWEYGNMGDAHTPTRPHAHCSAYRSILDPDARRVDDNGKEIVWMVNGTRAPDRSCDVRVHASFDAPGDARRAAA